MTTVETPEVTEEAVETASVEPEVAEGAPAKVAAGGRGVEVAEDVAEEISRRFLALRERGGWSRSGIQGAVAEVAEKTEDAESAPTLDPEDFTPAKIWRFEEGRVHSDEVARARFVLDALEGGLVSPPSRVARRGGGRAGSAEANRRLERLTLELEVSRETLREVLEVLEAVRPSANRAQLAEAVADALRAIKGAPVDEDGEAVNPDVREA
jgi:hypothetical protein